MGTTNPYPPDQPRMGIQHPPEEQKRARHFQQVPGTFSPGQAEKPPLPGPSHLFQPHLRLLLQPLPPPSQLFPRLSLNLQKERVCR